uniref:Uncharacterized protein n=1 Tax=Anguilla anguilla TaxID=7936 RepID=A0A0E9UFS5_ANGAN
MQATCESAASCAAVLKVVW